MPLAIVSFYFKYIPKYSSSHEHFFQPKQRYDLQGSVLQKNLPTSRHISRHQLIYQRPLSYTSKGPLG